MQAFTECYKQDVYADAINLARFPYFATFASGGGRGGWCSPPGVSKLSVVELS